MVITEKKKTFWFYFRIVIVVLGYINGVTVITKSASETVDIPGYIWLVSTIFMLFIWPLMLLLVVGVQAINPRSAKIWRKPSWNLSPFLFSEPLQFLHMGGFFFLAGGLGYATATPFVGIGLAPVALAITFSGLGILLGIRICMMVFSKKMATDKE